MKRIGLFFIVLFILLFFMPSPSFAYVDSMQYGGSVTINNSGNASTLTDFQVSVTINTSALVSAGRMQTDCDDIRFVDSDATTKLSFWLESGCNTSSTKFWVKVPSIPGSSSKTIYVHFGNNSATSESNGSNTFIFFDDFNTFNSSVWTASNPAGATVSGGMLTVTTGSVYTNSTVGTQTGNITEARLSWANFGTHAGLATGNEAGTASSNGTNKKVAYILSPSDAGVIGSAGFTGYNIVNSTQLKIPSSGVGWTAIANDIHIVGFGFDSSKLYYYRDYAYNANNVFTGAGPWSAAYYVWLGVFSGSNAGSTNGTDVTADWVRIRKFITPNEQISNNEPSISANVGVTPSKPLSLFATGGNTKAYLTWSTPSTGSGITDYVVEYSTDGSSFSTFSDGTSTNTYATVTGLTNGTSYTFRVSATNSAGTGATSDTITATPTTSVLHGILVAGQSQAIGYNGFPALSSTQPYNNLKLDISDSTKFATLIENKDVNDDYTGATESPMSGLANTMTLLSTDHDYQSVILNNAVAGYAYADLKKGSTAYNNGIIHITTANSIGSTLGRTFKIEAVANIHGPADRTRANEYEGYLNEWQSDYQTDIKTVTGQSGDIPMFIDQSSNFTAYGTATSDLVIAQLAAAENNDKIYMVGPKYQFTYGTDWVHLVNESYQLLGDYYGKAIKKVVVDGDTKTALLPVQEVRKANVVTVRFDVPVTPLAFDTTTVLSKTNYGFEFYDNSGSTPAISSVELLSNDSVRITLAGTPTGSTQKIRYAYTGTAGTKPGAQQSGGARGNLRDSDTTEGSSGVPLYNWAVHFDKAITLDETGPTQTNITSTVTNSTIHVTWDTNEASTDTFQFGLTTSYGSSTTSNSRSTSHSTTFTTLVPCTTYNYRILSTDLAGNQTTSSDQTATTSGCVGGASIETSAIDNITTAAGGTITLQSFGKGISIDVPANFSSYDSNFQIKKIDKTTTFNTTSQPSGYIAVGSYVYDLKALRNNQTTVSSFSNDISVTFTYSDAEITRGDEELLKIYRWDGSSWNELSGCSINTYANTITCTTRNFSIFALFTPNTDPPSNNSSSSSSSSSSSTSSGPVSCSAQRPESKPELFQVDRSGSTATLYITPHSRPFDGFIIAYGPLYNTELYATSFKVDYKGGAIKYTVSHLDPNKIYNFKVKATHSCESGEWGNSMLVGLAKNSKVSFYKYGPAEVIHYVTQSVKNYIAPTKTKAVKKAPVKQKNHPKKTTPTPQSKTKVKK